MIRALPFILLASAAQAHHAPADGRMTPAEADEEIALMEAIAADYAEPDLFGDKQ